MIPPRKCPYHVQDLELPEFRGAIWEACEAGTSDAREVAAGYY